MLNDIEKEVLKVTLTNLKKVNNFKKVMLVMDTFSYILTLILFIVYGSLYIDSVGIIGYLWLTGSILFFIMTTFGFLQSLDRLCFKYFYPPYFTWISAEELFRGIVFEEVTRKAVEELKNKAQQEGVIYE
jgi:hypothetical protein